MMRGRSSIARVVVERRAIPAKKEQAAAGKRASELDALWAFRELAKRFVDAELRWYRAMKRPAGGLVEEALSEKQDVEKEFLARFINGGA